MKDPIERQEAVDAVESVANHIAVKFNYPKNTIMFLETVNDLLTAAPYIKAINALSSAQPEIVRCKDCKHYRSYAGYIDGCCHMAEWYKRYQYEDDFCSRAERRTDERSD